MSRVGKTAIQVPANVKVAVASGVVTVESGNKKLQMTHRPEVTVVISDDGRSVQVDRRRDDRMSRALHGTTRALIANMIEGVTKGYVKELEIVGVGWGAKLQGNRISLAVGYADEKIVNIPPTVTVEVQGAKIKISGADKQAVGLIAAQIRSHRPPEPYNGKGIKYAGEVIARKEGKAFAGGG